MAMRGTIRVSMLPLALGLALLATGCAAPGQARYVYQDGQFGVVGIPENSSRWPTYYRAQAEAMMQKHFPEGFEIVRAEEVVEGSRTLTVNGTSTAAVEAEGPIALVKVGKIGRSASRTQADSLKIKECRIVYRKKGCTDAEPELGFAHSPTLTPEPYLDPNAEARKHVVAKPKADEKEVDTAKLAEAAEKAAAETLRGSSGSSKSESSEKQEKKAE
jgi:hypothetical protein